MYYSSQFEEGTVPVGMISQNDLIEILVEVSGELKRRQQSLMNGAPYKEATYSELVDRFGEDGRKNLPTQEGHAEEIQVNVYAHPACAPSGNTHGETNVSL